jgi:hypothetical protein
VIDERLRPLTHALWTSGDEPPAELDTAALLRIAVLRNPLPLAGIVLPYAVSVWPASVQAMGPTVGTLRATIAGLGLLAVLALARLLRPERRAPHVAVLHLLLTILVATAVQIAQWDRFLGGMPEPSSIGLWVTVGTWLTVLDPGGRSGRGSAPGSCPGPRAAPACSRSRGPARRRARGSRSTRGTTHRDAAAR